MGGGALGEGVLGLVVVEGHLLDDSRVRDDLWEKLSQTVDYTVGQVVSGDKVADHHLSLECCVFDLSQLGCLGLGFLERLHDRLTSHCYLSIFLLANIGDMWPPIFMLLQIVCSMVTRQFFITGSAGDFVRLSLHRRNPEKLAAPGLLPPTAGHPG